jgi:hypothetical protein
MWSSADQNVLIENDKGLDGLHLRLSVAQYEIQILELGMDSVAYQIIVAIIFVM